MRVLASQQAADVDQPRQRSDCEGAAAESKQVDVVARLVLLHQVAVQVHHVRDHAGAETQFASVPDSAPDARPSLGQRMGADAGVVAGDLPGLAPLDPGVEPTDVARRAGVVVAGAVAADDNVLAGSGELLAHRANTGPWCRMLPRVRSTCRGTISMLISMYGRGLARHETIATFRTSERGPKSVV